MTITKERALNRPFQAGRTHDFEAGSRIAQALGGGRSTNSATQSPGSRQNSQKREFVSQIESGDWKQTS